MTERPSQAPRLEMPPHESPLVSEVTPSAGGQEVVGSPLNERPLPVLDEASQLAEVALRVQEMNHARVLVEQARSSELVGSVVDFARGKTHVTIYKNEGFSAVGDAPDTDLHHGSGIPVPEAKGLPEVVSFTRLVEPDRITVVHPATTEKSRLGKTIQKSAREEIVDNPNKGRAEQIQYTDAEGQVKEEPAVRFRYHFQYSDGNVPYRRQGRVQSLGVEVDLPASMAQALQEGMQADPTQVHALIEKICNGENGPVSDELWSRGDDRGDPVRPPYEMLPSNWQIALVTGDETIRGGYQDRGAVNKGYSVGPLLEKVSPLSAPQDEQHPIDTQPSVVATRTETAPFAPEVAQPIPKNEQTEVIQINEWVAEIARRAADIAAQHEEGAEKKTDNATAILKGRSIGRTIGDALESNADVTTVTSSAAEMTSNPQIERTARHNRAASARNRLKESRLEKLKDRMQHIGYVALSVSGFSDALAAEMVGRTIEGPVRPQTGEKPVGPRSTLSTTHSRSNEQTPQPESQANDNTAYQGKHRQEPDNSPLPDPNVVSLVESRPETDETEVLDEVAHLRERRQRRSHRKAA